MFVQSSSSSVFKSFFANYHNWDNSSHREYVDFVLYEIVKSRKSKEYKWKVESLDKSELVELMRVLTILEPSLKMQYSKTDKKVVVLSWTGEFNVPAQYFFEKQCSGPSYPPVVRQTTRVSTKSKVAKNPWTGRLRSISPVDYTEEE